MEVPKESSSLVQYDLIGQTVSSETIKSITGEMLNNSSQCGTWHELWDFVLACLLKSLVFSGDNRKFPERELRHKSQCRISFLIYKPYFCLK